jgi:WS/DGAT C-terminal domain
MFQHVAHRRVLRSPQWACRGGDAAALPEYDGAGRITVLSYLDHIDCGFVVCPEIVEEPWQLTDATSAEFAELEQAATRTASPPKRASKATAKGLTDGAGS